MDIIKPLDGSFKVVLLGADDDVSNWMHGLGGSACHPRGHLHSGAKRRCTVFTDNVDDNDEADSSADDASAGAGLRRERHHHSPPLDVDRRLQLPSRRRLVADVGLETERNFPEHKRHR